MKNHKKIVIVAHYLLYGAAHALRDYLLKKYYQNILFITLPLVSQRTTRKILYENKHIKEDISFTRKNKETMFDYFMDFFQVITFIFFQKEVYDIYFGFDCLNCLTGILLRKTGRIKKVIFYSIDFSPIRFKNPLINKVYHAIEKFCILHADEVWNVSPRIAEGRESFLHISSKKYHQKVVPIGVWTNDIKITPFKKVKKQQIVFLGHILEKQGVQKVIIALEEIRKKIPNIKLLIIGGGEYLDNLKKLVEKLKLGKHVLFTGWITDRSIIDKTLSESAVAVATYVPEKEKLYNFTYYADPTKLKDYLAAGLPIVMTDISYNAKIIEENKCGILVQYDEKEIASAIITLLKNENQLKKYKHNALQYSKTFDWEVIFDKALYEIK